MPTIKLDRNLGIKDTRNPLFGIEIKKTQYNDYIEKTTLKIHKNINLARKNLIGKQSVSCPPSVNNWNQASTALAQATEDLQSLWLLMGNDKAFEEPMYEYMKMLGQEWPKLQDLGSSLANCFAKTQGDSLPVQERTLQINQLISFFNMLSLTSRMSEKSLKSLNYDLFRKEIGLTKNTLFKQIFKKDFSKLNLDYDNPKVLTAYLKTKQPRELQPYYLALYLIARQEYASSQDYGVQYDDVNSFYASGKGDCTEFSFAYAKVLDELGFNPQVTIAVNHDDFYRSVFVHAHALTYVVINDNESILLDDQNITAYPCSDLKRVVFEHEPAAEYFQILDMVALRSFKRKQEPVILDKKYLNNRF